MRVLSWVRMSFARTHDADVLAIVTSILVLNNGMDRNSCTHASRQDFAMNCELSTGDGHAMGTVGGALLVVVGAWRALAAWRSKPKPCASSLNIGTR